MTGDGVPAGDRLVRHPSVRLVSLTGDTATGKLIAKNAADTVKRVHLELGGKAPMVVLDDADPATVAEAIKVGRLLQLRPGLHGLVADPRLRAHLRRRPLGDASPRSRG